MTPEQLIRMAKVSEKTIEAAQIFLAALPIMCVYPFLQKYYTKGIVVGSVKADIMYVPITKYPWGGSFCPEAFAEAKLTEAA